MKCKLLFDRESRRFFVKEPIGQDMGNGVMAVWDERIVDVTDDIIAFIQEIIER